MKRLYQAKGFNLLSIAIIMGCFLMAACDINKHCCPVNNKYF